MRKYRSGPAGAEPVRLGHAAVQVPEWILENIGNDNKFFTVHGRAARSRLRSNAKAVDSPDVGWGKARSGGMPHMLPVLVEAQDRTNYGGKLGFHHPYQLLQYFL